MHVRERNCGFLSKLDLSRGFYQIPIRMEDRDKTAFCSPYGKYRFTRMPFGLRNAPSTFQRTMHTVLRGQEDHSATYIDDILVYSRTWTEHLAHIQAILEALRENGMTAKLKKCKWAAKTLEYLGHIVGNGQVAVPEARVKSIRNFKRPVYKKDLRAFLGTTSYYRRFIPKYADHSFSLSKETKKAAPNRVTWSKEMESDFNYLCISLSNSCVLTIPVAKDIFLLQTDASGKGISGILSVIRNETEHPVAFYSRQLQDRERAYAATELECLAVKESVQHFEVYLHGYHFTVQTDHKALESLLKSTTLNPKLTRWALYLQQFDMEIQYRPGIANQNADGLSRQTWSVEDESQNDVQDKHLISNFQEEKQYLSERREMSGTDP